MLELLGAALIFESMVMTLSSLTTLAYLIHFVPDGCNVTYANVM